MRFAYLILAHNNFKVLSRLIELLDDQRNDIFVHFDAKVNRPPQLSTVNSSLTIVDRRVDVRWGTVSQIKAIFALLESACSSGEYDYFHIISGTHLPLKSQDFIHKHFAALEGASALRLWKTDEPDADFKLRRIHFGIDNFQSSNGSIRYAVQRLWTLNMFFQKLLGIRIYKDYTFIKADSWASMSCMAAAYLIENKDRILRKYRFSFCGDEYFLASELPENLPIVDDRALLFVSFDKYRPRTLTREDYESLKESEYLFARKFDDTVV